MLIDWEVSTCVRASLTPANLDSVVLETEGKSETAIIYVMFICINDIFIGNACIIITAISSIVLPLFPCSQRYRVLLISLLLTYLRGREEIYLKTRKEITLSVFP